ncbi:MAG: hypothetical protein K0R73_907 [Candidatus Midichloriaceae bacterium]|jgi:hypothetical protein|nr:hypothetical protein [Candidatus Midichloriaceae bacterium]
MRKIFSVLLLVALAFVANFSLWFLHTRVIHSSLAQFKKELSNNNIFLTYDDIKFTNFKSWRVDGNLAKVQLMVGKEATNIIKFATLKFRSLPFDKKIQFSIEGAMNTTVKEGEIVKESFNFVPKEGVNPEISINLETALKNISDELKDPDEPKLHLIDSLLYTDNGFDVFDANTNTLAWNVGPSKIEIDASKNAHERRVNFTLIIKDIVFNKGYKPNKYNEALHKLRLRLGNSNFDIQFSYVESPSKRLLELMSRDKENKKNYKKIFDSYQINIKQFKQVTDLYSMNLIGELDRQPDVLLPLANISLSIDGYKEFAKYMSDFYNTILDDVVAKAPSFPATKMTPARINKFTEFLGSLNQNTDLNKEDDNKDNIMISITHSRGGDLYISQKSFFNVFNEFQNIFNDKSQNHK